jgi:hypothetical protein
MLASRRVSLPISLATIIANTNTQTVPIVVAITNGGLLSSENGVRDMMPNSSAGSDT